MIMSSKEITKKGESKMKKRILTFITTLMMAVTIISVPVTDEVSAASTLYWPVPNHTSLSQGFHDGNAIDISDGSIAGSTVVAAISGKVTHIYKCGSQHYGSYHNCNGFGTGLVIAGDDGRTYQYAHMQANSIPSNVYNGARVSSGQSIGRVGTTGYSSGNHLHFAISIGNYWNKSGINPANENYINKTTTAPAVTVSWGSFTCTPKNTDAYIYTKVTTSKSGKFSQAGINVWDSNGKLVATKTENVSYTRSDMAIWYNLTEETGAVLKPGSNYTYQFWATFNGKKYTCSKKSFKTTGSAPVTTTPSVTKPAAPSTVRADLYGYDDLAVSWSNVSGASGYHVQYKKSSSSSFSSKVAVNGTSCKINNLTDGTSYCVRITPYVKSGNKIYEGSYKDSAYVYTLKKVNIKSVSKSGTLAKVKWTNIPGETGYEISRSAKKSGTNVMARYFSGTVSEYAIAAPKYKTNYYKVRAFKDVNGKRIYGPWSNTIKFVRK